jgi:hypothetical protein
MHPQQVPAPPNNILKAVADPMTPRVVMLSLDEMINATTAIVWAVKHPTTYSDLPCQMAIAKHNFVL